MEKKLLIVDDQESIRLQLKWAFSDEYRILLADSVKEALKVIEKDNPPVMLLDLSLTPGSGPEGGFSILDAALKSDAKRKVIIVTGHDAKENAIKAVSAGAHDFCSKPIDIEELKVIVKRAFRVRELEEENEKLRGAISKESSFITQNPYLLDMLERVKSVARTDVTVLVTGESGTGKELVAKMVHEHSDRAEKPLVVVNCGAIPETLLESELFGYEKGAFTGAVARQEGKIERAGSGTLFLDEIGEMSLTLQTKILRFLQEGEIEPLGGKTKHVDVRVVAATNKNLKEEEEGGRFRNDLFYRISVINFHIPPLRERPGDVELLGYYYLNRFSQELKKTIRDFSESAIHAMKIYDWPGNVRELQNRVKRAVLLAQGPVVDAKDMELSTEQTGRLINGTLKLRDVKSLAEKGCVERALEQSAGNVTEAADILGISRVNLYNLMKKHNISREESEGG